MLVKYRVRVPIVASGFQILEVKAKNKQEALDKLSRDTERQALL